MSKNIGLPLLSISKMPTNTFPVVFGVQQNPCKCQCRAYFIKKVKLRKHLLKMFHKKVSIFEKYLSRSSHFQNVAGSKNEPFHRYFVIISNLKIFSVCFLKSSKKLWLSKQLFE